jgi:hypothetical protein
LDFIIWIVVEIFKALSKDRTSKPPDRGAIVPSRGVAAASRAPARPQPPAMTSAAQEPVFDDGGWRRLVAVLGIIVLIAMVAIWFVYTRGGS